MAKKANAHRSASDRRKLEAKIGVLYKRLECELDTCWYCGDPRETLDHVPPLAIVMDMELSVLARKGIKLCLVPSCRSCNQILGKKALLTPAERVAHLYEKYEEKVNKRGNLWEPQEVKQLGYNMRKIVESSNYILANLMRKHRGCERRLATLSGDYS